MPPDRSTPAFLLRAAALLLGLAGGGFMIWLIDKALRHPAVQAAQGSAAAPWWAPFTLFTAAAVGLMIYLFLRAARRVEAGEDLFARRHRRRPADSSRGSRMED